MKAVKLFGGWWAGAVVSFLALWSANAQILLTYDAADSIPNYGTIDDGYPVGLYAFDLTGFDHVPYYNPDLSVTGTGIIFDFPQNSDGYALGSVSIPSGWAIKDEVISVIEYRFENPSGEANGTFLFLLNANLSGDVSWNYWEPGYGSASGDIIISVAEPAQSTLIGMGLLIISMVFGWRCFRLHTPPCKG